MPVEFLRDTFQRADSTTVGAPTFGPTWTEVEAGGSATVGISSNKLSFNTPTGTRAGVFVNSGSSSHGISVKISAQSAYWYLGVRLPSAQLPSQAGGNVAMSPGSGIVLMIDPNGNLALYKSVGAAGAGTFTSVDNAVPNSSIATVYAGDEISISTSGSYIRAWVNGVLVVAANDTQFVGQSYVGVWVQGSGSSSTLSLSQARASIAQTSYPNPGMPQMALDRDGSTVYKRTGAGTKTTLSTAEVKSLLDVTGTTSVTVGGSNGRNDFYVMFPEPRNIYGYFLRYPVGVSTGWELLYTTTSVIGTAPESASWATYVPVPAATAEASSPTNPSYRTSTSIFTPGSGLTMYGVTGVRLQSYDGFSNTSGLSTLHLYGLPQYTANVHRIQFWHPYLDIPLPGSYLDIDDVIRGQIAYREFRIKNGSSVYTMNNIVLDLESIEYGTALTDEFSIKRASEGTYQPNTTISTLAPGATSEIISIRRIVGAAAPFRLDSLRVRSQIGSLT